MSTWQIEKYCRIISCNEQVYEQLAKSDMFFDIYPDLTGEYEEDIQIAKFKIDVLLAQERDYS